MREKLSAFVISYNRAALLETCLRAVSFADELIVVDKSSTDNSVSVATNYAHRVEVVPWSPTVEETRSYALSLCRNEWILYLDDDEILSGVTGPFLRGLIAAPTADIYSILSRHYILGVHDEQAYYWPECHNRLFRRGTVEFLPTVHGGTVTRSNRIAAIPPHSGVCVHHLSHPDVASWVERANRYTASPDRVRVNGGEDALIPFAHQRIDYWMGRTSDQSPNGYPAAAALLRAIYDMIDRLKAWEEARGLDGAALLRLAAEHLTRTHENAVAKALVRHTVERTRLNAAIAETAIERDAARTETAAARAEALIARAAAEVAETEALEARAEVLTARSETTAARAHAFAEQAEAGAARDAALARAMAARAEADTARAETAAARADTLAATAEAGAARLAALASVAAAEEKLERLSGSARQFLPQYLPRLRRHLFR